MVASDLVVKSNKLVEASYKLTLTEQQLILYAIGRSRNEDIELSASTSITIHASEFAAKFDIGRGTVYEQIKESMAALYRRTVTLHDVDPDTGKARVTETRWISDQAYIDGAGQVQITFANKIIPFISKLECEFTSYRIEKIRNMSSSYAIRMYELLIQYLTIGRREVEVSWLRERLCLTTEYPRMLDFKKRVIEVAVTQINQHSDIDVSYTQRKTGKSVTHLTFEIKEKLSSTKTAVPSKVVRDKNGIDRAYIEKHARPGESYDQAYRRLLEEKNAQQGGLRPKPRKFLLV